MCTDSSEGDAALLHTVEKKSLRINFTISHFSILIKKQQLPLKTSTLLRKTRIPGPVCRPWAQFKDTEMLLGLSVWACTVQHKASPSWRFVMSWSYFWSRCVVDVCVYVTRLPFVVLSSSLSSKVMKRNPKCHVSANYVFLFFPLKCIQMMMLRQLCLESNVKGDSNTYFWHICVHPSAKHWHQTHQLTPLG